MQSSESEEIPSFHESLTCLGKLIQAWVYVGKHPKNNKTMKFHCVITSCEKQII